MPWMAEPRRGMGSRRAGAPAAPGMPKGAALILEGGFDPNGQFYFLPIHDTARLAQLLRQRTVGLFLKLGLITEQFSETLLCWRHSGFSVDNSVRLDGGDHTARQALAQYIARAPLPLQKLPDDRAGGRSCITPPVIPVSGRTRTRGAPLTSSLISLSSSPGEYAPSTPTGCTPHDVPSGRSLRAHDGAARRLSLSVCEADCEGGRGRSLRRQPLRAERVAAKRTARARDSVLGVAPR